VIWGSPARRRSDLGEVAPRTPAEPCRRRAAVPQPPRPLGRRHGHARPRCRLLPPRPPRSRRRLPLHLLHLPPPPSPWLLGRRQRSPPFPPRPVHPPPAPLRAPCRPGPRLLRRWRRSRRPLRELPRDSGCLSRVAHLTRLRCSCLAGCGCANEFAYRRPGWRLISRKIKSGLLPKFQVALLPP
jgi:hypothetical protein